MIFVWAIAVTAGIFVGLTLLLLVSQRWLVNYGDCTINVNNGEKVVTVKGGDTLLSALKEHGFSVPSACAGKGSCGYCKVAVPSGAGQILPTEIPYMSRSEVRRNIRLACQVKVKNDLQITIPDFLAVVKSMVENKNYNPKKKWRFVVE